MDNPRRDQVKDVLAISNHDSVPGIGAALKSGDDISLGSEKIDDLTLTLITPLTAYDYFVLTH